MQLSMPLLEICMFTQTFMLAAKDRGLDTRAQGAWNLSWIATRRILSKLDDEYIFAGMPLGYADADDPVNGVITAREPLDQTVTFHG
jgi:nitroreductase